MLTIWREIEIWIIICNLDIDYVAANWFEHYIYAACKKKEVFNISAMRFI